MKTRFTGAENPDNNPTVAKLIEFVRGLGDDWQKRQQKRAAMRFEAMLKSHGFAISKDRADILIGQLNAAYAIGYYEAKNNEELSDI